jgi:hypothetical protein
MDNVTGEQVLRALAMLGHSVHIHGEEDAPHHQQIVTMHYRPARQDRMATLTVHVDDEALAHADDPDQAMAFVLAEALRKLVPDQVRSAAQVVIEAETRGPIPAELIGGSHDGEILTGLQTDRDGWPIQRVYLPDPMPMPLPSVLDVLGSPMAVSTYDRDYVSPYTLHWRYLATKGT